MEKDGDVAVELGHIQRGDRRAGCTPSLNAGEARLGFWAESLGRYRQTMDTFFRLYAGMPPHTDEN